MKINKDVLCFHCKNCGDIDFLTVFSADANGEVAEKTTLGKIYCDSREDIVEPHIKCPYCVPDYEEDTQEVDGNTPEHSGDIVLSRADEMYPEEK